MKTYKQFNESIRPKSIRDKMTGKSIEDIKKIDELNFKLNANLIDEFRKMGVNLGSGKYFNIDKVYDDIKKNSKNLSEEDIQKIFDDGDFNDIRINYDNLSKKNIQKIFDIGFNADVYDDFCRLNVDLFKGKYLNIEQIFNDMKNYK